MAYILSCDDCAAELESGPGRPHGSGAREAFCVSCAAINVLVEREITRMGTEWAMETSERLQTKRKQLRDEMRGQRVPDGTGWPQGLPRVE